MLELIALVVALLPQAPEAWKAGDTAYLKSFDGVVILYQGYHSIDFATPFTLDRVVEDDPSAWVIRTRSRSEVVLHAPTNVLARKPGPVYASPQSVSVPAPQPRPQPAPSYVVQGDPYSFGAWLNGIRAQNGRGPVAYDHALTSDAAVNNSFGFGHHWLGRARRQNAGMGAAANVWSMWTISPGHMDALMDPSITRYGIHCNGSIWTYNAY